MSDEARSICIHGEDEEKCVRCKCGAEGPYPKEERFFSPKQLETIKILKNDCDKTMTEEQRIQRMIRESNEITEDEWS